MHRPLTDSIQPHIRQALSVSLTAAAQIVLSQSSYKAELVFSLDSQNPSTFPDGAYHADRGSVSRLYYAVDSTWISHTFAITFLSLCYIRGIIDGETFVTILGTDNLNLSITNNMENRKSTKSKPKSQSRERERFYTSPLIFLCNPAPTPSPRTRYLR